MKSLYNANDLTFTDDAIGLENIFIDRVKSLFEGIVKKGYSPREVSHFLTTCIWDLELTSVLDIKYKEAQSRNNA